jgi:hypothetical protein
MVITHTMQAMEDMLASFYAQIAADEVPQSLPAPASTAPGGVTWT